MTAISKRILISAILFFFIPACADVVEFPGTDDIPATKDLDPEVQPNIEIPVDFFEKYHGSDLFVDTIAHEYQNRRNFGNPIRSQSVRIRREAAATFFSPSHMVEGSWYELTALIALLEHEETHKELKTRLESEALDRAGENAETGGLEFKFILAGEEMRATLRGPEFEISEDPALRSQLLDFDSDNALAEWIWQVRPKNAGKLSLSVQLARVVDMADGQQKYETASAFRRTIEVLPALDKTPSVMDAPTKEVSLASKEEDFSLPNTCKEHYPKTATKRHAFVLANQDYNSTVGGLSLTKQDGVNVRNALVKAGFDVIHCFNSTAEDTLIATDLVARRVLDSGNESIATFYYSGHGVNLGKPHQTYILPVDFKRRRDADFSTEAVSLDEVMVRLDSADPEHLVLLFDACREVMVGAERTKGLGRRERWPVNLYFGYANEFGEKTPDNGVYSQELARWIGTENADIVKVLDEVQNNVSIQTNRGQFPEYEDKSDKSFVFTEKALSE